MITKEAVLEELKKVIDPELHINIVDLGLVYDIAFDPSAGASTELSRTSSGQVNVIVTMTLTTPGCPLSMVFEEWVPAAVKNIKEVKDVKINLIWEPPWDPDKMSDEAKEQMGFIN